MQIPVASDIDLLLIGKTGNGKSATANSILKRKVFEVSASVQSVTTKVSWDIAEHENHVIKVVDGPGVGDTRMSSEEGINLFMNAMEFAVMANPKGYHAFLLVVRFGARFTEEDQDTIRLMKQVFGPDFVSNYCIMVMTNGDSFAREAEEEGITFPQWCGQQTGVMQELMRECNGRIVLFDNVTKDQDVKARQLNELFQHVHSLKCRGVRYTDANFARAQAAREKVRIEAKRPMIQDETMCQISLLLQRLTEIQGAFDSSTQLQDLEALNHEAQLLVKSVRDQDKGTGALQEICNSTESIQNTINEAIATHKRVEDEKLKAKQQEAEIAARLQKEREKMVSDIQKQSQEDRDAMKKRIEELEAQNAREKEEREKALAIRQQEEQTRLSEMTQNNLISWSGVRIMIDRDLFDSIINVTKGIFTTIASWFKRN